MLPRAGCFAAGATVVGLAILGVQADEFATCYFPGGEVAGGFYPCIAFDAAYSACCPAGWSCFSNALCVATTPSPTYPNLTYGAAQRAACTSPQWANNVCGDFCLDADNEAGKLIYCGDDRFCCENDFNTGKCSCAGNGNVTTIKPGRFQTIVHVTDVSFTGTPSISIATTSANVRPTTARTSTAGSSSSAGTVSPAETDRPASGTPSSGDNGKRNLIIGLVVGLVGGLLVLLLGALAVWSWKKKNKSQANYNADPVEEKPMSTPSVSAVPSPPIEPPFDGDLRADDVFGPVNQNDYGRPRRVDI